MVKENKTLDKQEKGNDFIADISSCFSANDIDLAYLIGVFNVSGIDGLSNELKRLKEINKKPHEIFTSFSNVR